ncbi:hypothetical protein PQR14_04550 [Paraburkholderia bryophila]|uniref:hypothetical protein n=1 Tax=Paraburkholderia bryophila TaxID=420952 RepID=UPI0015CE84F3
MHNHDRVFALIFVVVTTAIFRWLRWRNAKASGITRLQFAEIALRPGEKELQKAQLLRLSGWVLILLPVFAGPMSLISHRDTLFMSIGAFVLLEIFLGALGWFMLWLASQCKERARQMGAIL